MKSGIFSQLRRVAALTSQTINCPLFFGHHDQTISFRCWTNRGRGGWSPARKIIDEAFARLPLIGHENHCHKIYLSDVRYSKEILSIQKKV